MRSVEDIVIIRRYEREIKMTKYMIERLGDIDGKTFHNSLDEALTQLEKEYPLRFEKTNGWGDPLNKWVRMTPDIEDDRILIWEILPSNHSKVVWHFSGWHWDCDEFGLPQGKLPKDKKSLYELGGEDY